MMHEKEITAKVDKISPLTDSIIKLTLCPQEYVDYLAGQYLQILFQDEYMSYSIANAPLGAHKYELHIRHSRDNSFNQELLAEIKEKGEVSIRIPLGECHLRNLKKNKPIIFIAGGTGFAPIKAMIEQLLANSDPRSFELYWGARSQSDLYMDNKAKYWHEHVSHFRYFSSFSNSRKAAIVEEICRKHGNDINDWQILISGPFDMVFYQRDLLIEKGIKREDIYSDAFSFE